MPPSRPSRADVFDPGPRPAVSHELRALVVEDEQMLVGFDEIDALAGEESGDVEPGLADLDDSVGGDRGAADAVPANRSLLVSWPRWVVFRCRIPGLLRGNSARQSLMRPLSVIDPIERINLALQHLKGFGERLFIKPAEQRLVGAFLLAQRGRFLGFAGDGLDAEPSDVGVGPAPLGETSSAPPRT